MASSASQRSDELSPQWRGERPSMSIPALSVRTEHSCCTPLNGGAFSSQSNAIMSHFADCN